MPTNGSDAGFGPALGLVLIGALCLAWQVAADDNVTIKYDNAGPLEHNWVILTAGKRISSEAELLRMRSSSTSGPSAPGPRRTRPSTCPAARTR